MNVSRDCLDIRIRNRVPWSMAPRFQNMREDVDFAMRVVTDGIFSSGHPWYIRGGWRFVLE